MADMPDSPSQPKLFALLSALAELTRLAFRFSLDQRGMDGVRLDDKDVIPRIMTSDARSRFQITIRKVFCDKENVHYALVSSEGPLAEETGPLIGRRLQWLVGLVERYNDILEDRMYDDEIFEDYSILDGVDLENDALLDVLSIKISERLREARTLTG